MKDADYFDDQALFANKMVQAESLLHRMEQAARSFGLNINLNKT